MACATHRSRSVDAQQVSGRRKTMRARCGKRVNKRASVLKPSPQPQSLTWRAELRCLCANANAFPLAPLPSASAPPLPRRQCRHLLLRLLWLMLLMLLVLFCMCARVRLNLSCACAGQRAAVHKLAEGSRPGWRSSSSAVAHSTTTHSRKL